MSARRAASRCSIASTWASGSRLLEHRGQLALRGRELLDQRLAPQARLLRRQPRLLHRRRAPRSRAARRRAGAARARAVRDRHPPACDGHRRARPRPRVGVPGAPVDARSSSRQRLGGLRHAVLEFLAPSLQTLALLRQPLQRPGHRALAAAAALQAYHRVAQFQLRRAVLARARLPPARVAARAPLPDERRCSSSRPAPGWRCRRRCAPCPGCRASAPHRARPRPARSRCAWRRSAACSSRALWRFEPAAQLRVLALRLLDACLWRSRCCSAALTCARTATISCSSSLTRASATAAALAQSLEAMLALEHAGVHVAAAVDPQPAASEPLAGGA